mmetsp:Transcript_25474/g.42952  ORF Transcript_25474/g.42952 Transcript_25474/m.42952 type:complete len:427 (+) Transcript_25474:115-1395(+)
MEPETEPLQRWSTLLAVGLQLGNDRLVSAGSGGLSVFHSHLQGGHAVLVGDGGVGVVIQKSVHHLQVGETSSIVQGSVPSRVLHIQADSALGDEVLHHVVVAPVGSLVQSVAARCRLHFVHISSGLLELLHLLNGTVHGILTELRTGCGRVLTKLGAGGRAVQRQELGVGGGEVAEEGLLVVRIQTGRLGELGVGAQRHVSGKHHEALGLHVLILEIAIPLAGLPLLVHELHEVVVVEGEGTGGPGAVEAGAGHMAASQGVGTREGHDLGVIEAHATKHVTEMGSTLRGIRETAIGGTVGAVRLVRASQSMGNLWASSELDGSGASSGPEVSRGQLRVLGRHRVQHVADNGQPGVGSVAGLGLEAHGGAITAASVGLLAVGAGRMPGDADRHGTGIDFVVDQSASDIRLESIVIDRAARHGVCEDL